MRILRNAITTNERFDNIQELHNKETDRIIFNCFKEHWQDNFISTVAEFYTIQLMKELTRRPDGFNPMTCSPLQGTSDRDIFAVSPYWCGFSDRMSRNEEAILSDLENFFIIYIFSSCVGEARHLPYRTEEGKKYLKSVNKNAVLPEWIPSGLNINREHVWQAGFNIYLNTTSEQFMVYCKDVLACFTDFTWDGGYGGGKWGVIMQHLVAYLNGEINQKIFVDQAISLAHNGSLFVDKIGISITRLKSLLDFKFRAYLLDIPHVISFMHWDTKYEEAFNWALSQIDESTISVPSVTIAQDAVSSVPFPIKVLSTDFIRYLEQHNIKIYNDTTLKLDCPCPSCLEIKELMKKYHEQLSNDHYALFCGVCVQGVPL